MARVVGRRGREEEASAAGGGGMGSVVGRRGCREEETAVGGGGVTWVVGRRGRGEEGLAARGSGGMVRAVGQRGRGEEGGGWHAVKHSEERAIHTGGRHAVVVALSRGTCSGVLNTLIAHSNMHRNPVSMKVQEIRGMLLAGCCATRCKSWWAMSGAKGTAFGMAQGDSQSGKGVCEACGICLSNAPAQGARLVLGDEKCW